MATYTSKTYYRASYNNGKYSQSATCCYGGVWHRMEKRADAEINTTQFTDVLVRKNRQRGYILQCFTFDNSRYLRVYQLD